MNIKKIKKKLKDRLELMTTDNSYGELVYTFLVDGFFIEKHPITKKINVAIIVSAENDEDTGEARDIVRTVLESFGLRTRVYDSDDDGYALHCICGYEQ